MSGSYHLDVYKLIVLLQISSPHCQHKLLPIVREYEHSEEQSSDRHYRYTFSIDGHSLTVIEADGVETEPVVVDELNIFAGQRYSVIVEANQTAGNYCTSGFKLVIACPQLLE